MVYAPTRIRYNRHEAARSTTYRNRPNRRSYHQRVVVMRILITGANGQVGRSLVQNLTRQGHDITGVDIDTMDVCDHLLVRSTFADVQPEFVIHCAALTAVDRCAEHPDEALAINGFGTRNVSLGCQAHNSTLIYISTNEVFAGTEYREYQEYDPPSPSNPYGYSKWVGEQTVRDLVSKHFIVRTSWLFAHGGHNFVHTILRLAKENKRLRIVTNEVSSPTYGDDLMAAIEKLIDTRCYGIYHLVNQGHASRYQFARHLLDMAGYTDFPLEPISLAEYPRSSRPPQYAILRNFAAAQLGITLRPWQEALAAFMEKEREFHEA
jgi:dTDP-4-dehydrorhamnose reductase